MGHDDTIITSEDFLVSRTGVAAVVSEAVMEKTSGLRFDLCATTGAPTTDLQALLQSARWSF